MEPDFISEIEREITRLYRRYEALLLRESPGAHELTGRWLAESGVLCWYVPLEDIVEPDIDVELAGEVVIVRAQRVAPEPTLLLALAPVPSGFDRQHPQIRFFEGTLEIRVRRIASGSGR